MDDDVITLLLVVVVVVVMVVFTSLENFDAWQRHMYRHRQFDVALAINVAIFIVGNVVL